MNGRLLCSLPRSDREAKAEEELGRLVVGLLYQLFKNVYVHIIYCISPAENKKSLLPAFLIYMCSKSVPSGLP